MNDAKKNFHSLKKTNEKTELVFDTKLLTIIEAVFRWGEKDPLIYYSKQGIALRYQNVKELYGKYDSLFMKEVDEALAFLMEQFFPFLERKKNI